MTKVLDVAVVGPNSLVGQELLKLLVQRKFPCGTVHALDTAGGVGEFVDFGDDELQVRDLEGFDFTNIQIALFALDPASAATCIPVAAEAGCIAIDSSSAFRADAEVPLVVPEVNPQAVEGYLRRGIIASPDCNVVQMLVALQPIHAAAGVTRINIATYQPVAGNGQLAIDELVRQSIQALNGQGVDDFRLYPKPIAYNVLPQTDAFAEDGETREEAALRDESRRVLSLPDLGVNATTARVPVFHGCSQALHIETARHIDAAQARELLRQAPGVTVVDTAQNGGYPTAFTEAAQEDAVFVGRVRQDRSHPNGLDLWVVSDSIRRGAAINCLQIAEILARDHL